MSSADEDAAGISASLGDEGAALQRAQDKIATMHARAGALDELPPVRSARRRRQQHRRPPAGARRSRVAAEVDKELAAVKAEIGPGSSAPPELAGS
jgi:phage shock protein A